MKALPWWITAGYSFLLLAGTAWSQSLHENNEPFAEIRSVQLKGTNVVVEAAASSSFFKVTLESTTRVGRRAWVPRAVHHLEPGDGVTSFTFTVPLTPALEILRVRGDTTSPLPSSFYEGATNFVSGTANNRDPVSNVDVLAPGESDAGADEERTVVESDIWKLEGDTLFFFNQYRGLQVIDVSDPDAPAITGTFDLPAAGEQMYVMNGHRVVLLAKDTCSWYGNSSESRVVLLDAADGEPRFVAQLPVKGYIVESRLVGDALYVVANSYRERLASDVDSTGSATVWEWGSDLYSFDLSDFHAPVARSTDWVAGYNNVILATDRFLLVAQYQYSNHSENASTIHIYDISAPDGTFEKLSTTPALGIVRDKFKLNISGDILSVVSQRDSIPGRPTMVETISLEDPRNPAPLGSLKIIEDEQLHATRFYGDLLYVVTFMQVDPLWIIDLSNPANPEIKGELEIPGWSTYIHPLPGQLLTIGLDNTAGWRTSVQLFDVSDVSNPTLTSKVLIGDSYSGSEANYDEKAFRVIPEENLVLVPFYGNTQDQNWINGVQIIDLLPDELVKRGIIEQEFQPRRATLHNERILSISARELLSVDATDRDHPQVTGTTELSWATDQVHLVGSFLLEVDSQSGATPSMRVVSTADPSAQMNKVTLTNLPYLGSTVAGDKLYVLQGSTREIVYSETGPATGTTNSGTISVSVYDLSSLPAITLLSQSDRENATEYFYGLFEPVWVRDELVVWVNTQNYGWPIYYFDTPVAIEGRLASPGFAPDVIGGGLWWGGSSGQFIAMTISGDEASVASVLRLNASSHWWNFSDSYAASGMLYTSHLTSEFDPEFDPPPYTWQRWDGSNVVTVTNDPPKGAYVQRHYLDVIDYADPADPVVRKPVNIPGSLIGVHQGGELLFTRGRDLNSNYWEGGTESISASAYDGVQASLIDTLPLGDLYPKPALTEQGYVYLGQRGSEGQTGSKIEVWTLDIGGEFTLANSVELAHPANQLAMYGGLLAVQTSRIELYDATAPPALEWLGEASAQACYGVVLDNGDGDVENGLWLPLGWYGVIHIPVDPLDATEGE